MQKGRLRGRPFCMGRKVGQTVGAGTMCLYACQVA